MIDTNNLKDNLKGILIEKNDSTHLIVTFGGVNRGIGVPVFEFFNILRENNTDKAFVRDFLQMWYLNGVDDEISTFEKLKVQLESVIKGYEKVTFIGNSMGGYAAILFGVLLKVDKVVAFAPQTFIDAKNRFWRFDRRWRIQINKIHRTKLYMEYYDLKSFFNKIQINQEIKKTSIDIYYSTKHRLDRQHAEQLKNFKNVTLYGYKDGGHEVIKTLKSSGELRTVLKNL